MIVESLEQSLLFYPLVLGIYLSYHILKITDLTVEGSFVVGAALYARLLTLYENHPLALTGALLGGMACGAAVSFMQRKGSMNGLVASIIMLFMLYSLNLQIMGRPNISLLNYDVFSTLQNTSFIKLIFLILLGACLLVDLTIFLKMRVGLSCRAFGHQPNLLQKYNQNPETYRLLGLLLSNMLAALCGALTAQFSGYADIHMGFGMALIGIGAVVIGQHLFASLRKARTFQAGLELLACFGGIYLYFLISHLLLSFDIDPINLRLCLGLLLILCLRSPILMKGRSHA
jgi:putative tryptophan/tyrosine transport system permease protein